MLASIIAVSTHIEARSQLAGAILLAAFGVSLVHNAGAVDWAGEVSSVELNRRLDALFIGKSTKDLESMTAFADDWLAIHAAWKLVQGKGDKASEGEAADAPAVPLNRESLMWFIGFVEGRMKIRLPEWWRTRLGTLRRHWGDRFFSSAERPLESFVIRAGGISHPRRISLRKEDGLLWITDEADEVAVPLYLLTEGERVDLDVVAADHASNMWFVTETSDYHAYNLLWAIDSRSGTVRWSQKVFRGAHPDGGGALAVNSSMLIDITVCDKKVVVTGESGFGLFLEVFDAETGEVVLRFATS